MEQKVNQSIAFEIGQKIDLQASFAANGLTTKDDVLDEHGNVKTSRRRKSVLEAMPHPKWIYKDVPVIKIVNSIRDQPVLEVTDRHRRQFAQKWKDFTATPQYTAYIERDEDEPTTYHPLSDLLGKVRGAGPATLKSLEAGGITTVEMLAAADGDDINHVRKWQPLQEAALELLTA